MYHADDYRDLQCTLLHEGKETVKSPESVGLTRKPKLVYGLILEEEHDDEFVSVKVYFFTVKYYYKH